MSKNIAVVGSGFLGLTLALRLAEQGNKVTVFESAAEIGGLASAWRIGDDIVWDRHYHVTLLSDAYTRRIVEEIGLGDEFEWVETKTGFYTDGKLISMSNTLEFLKFPPLGFISKIRLGGTIFYAARVKNWKALEKIPVENWLTKLSGKRTFEKMWRPLLKAKLGGAFRETSAAFIWATIQRMYAARNSGLKKEMFGYVRGGYARVLERFGEYLREKGVEIRLGSPVERIEKTSDGKIRIFPAKTRRREEILTKSAAVAAGLQISNYELHNKIQAKVAALQTEIQPETAGFDGEKKSEISDFRSEIDENRKPETENRFDQVILTCPSGAAAKICPQLSDEEKAKLENIKYQGIVCASVLLKKSLSNFYVTNITDESPFTGIIEMSALVDKREFGGSALVYLPKYVAPDDELFERSDAEIEETFVSALEKMYSHFSRADVLEFKISRVRQVFPIPTLNYSARLPAVQTSLDGVYIVNSAQITNGTLNVNETVQLAEKFMSHEQTRKDTKK